MDFKTGMGGRLGISGTFECKDKDGVVLKTIELRGSVPLEDLGLTVEQAQALVDSQGADSGPDHR